MTKSNRLGTALTAVSLAAMVAGCSGMGSKPRSASLFGGKMDASNIGLATRAQVALAQNDIAGAIPLAERAVANSPSDATFRALLGNCYLAAGRFVSAEAAYRDSLSLMASQPQVILKLALIQIAQGKNDQARAMLAEAQSILDPADTGLALALAGDPQTAIGLLEQVARSSGADGRTRQNLALAHALAGDWTQARTVAAQDVPADQLDARIQQWMALANPARTSDQVAAFIGIQPVAGDPGQPVRLALNKSDANRQAASEPVTGSSAELTSTATVDLPAVAEPAPQPVAVAAAEVAPQPAPEPALLAEARPALSPAAVRLSDPLPKPRKASAPRPAANGKSRAVVQLGAYSSRDRVAAAWGKVSGRHGSLKGFTPVTARFSGAKGTVYRLAVKGFDSDAEARGLCASIKRSGGSCFVRSASGDAPVKLASRS